MERLLKLVHSKAAEEKQVLSSTENTTNNTNNTNDTNNTKRKVRNETSPSPTTNESNNKQVEDVKEKEVVLVDFEKPPSSSAKVAKVREEQMEMAHLVDDDQGRLLEMPTIWNKTKVLTCDEAPASNKNHTEADVTTTDIETSTDKGRQLVNNNLREENNTGKTMLRNSDKEDTGEDTDVCESDVFEDKAAVIRREKSISRGGEREGGPDFFERAYPILYEPLNSTSSIYDPSRETSFDPFRSDFGTKTTSSVRSSCVPDLSEITLVGDDVVKKRRKKELKSLKEFFKNNQDFQEYSDYIFVENMCKAEAGAPSAATSLKVLLSVASNKRILAFNNFTQISHRKQFLTWFHLRNVCVVKEMHILWRKSLNGNCAAAFDILDKKEFARERVRKEERQL